MYKFLFVLPGYEASIHLIEVLLTFSRRRANKHEAQAPAFATRRFADELSRPTDGPLTYGGGARTAGLGGSAGRNS